MCRRAHFVSAKTVDLWRSRKTSAFTENLTPDFATSCPARLSFKPRSLSGGWDRARCPTLWGLDELDDRLIDGHVTAEIPDLFFHAFGTEQVADSCMRFRDPELDSAGSELPMQPR
jgi:hypothetical protein